ncbi:MAG: hypothetical protein ACTHJR_12035 [Sphingomonas sp.]|uniref:helix-hairpin-helix domain-containing protein n=1 Tax=Sphingomonas sp. TaxID=28214 RepID=UPI003F8207C6
MGGPLLALARNSLAVRYALAGLKSVGEGAMERLVEERDASGPFATLDAFAHRVDPRLLNKRQLETLAAAGAFDAIDPNRAGIYACAETILATAARVHEQKHSGPGGLFGESEASGTHIKLPLSARWSLAERMEQEKEAFGFYFSAHPVDRFAQLAKMHGARRYADLGDLQIPEDGRAGAVMAAMVEDTRWRTSAKGRRYLMATLSDPSGQFIATCFDDSVAAELEEAARDGGCGLITVELDRRAGEEQPRVTVKRIQPFEELASSTRMNLDIAIDDAAAIPGISALLSEARGARGEARLLVPLPAGGTATVLLGRDFLLDPELADRIAALPGVRSAEVAIAPPQRLALVG